MAYTVFRLNHVHPDPSDGSEMSDRYRAALDMVEFLDQRGLNAVQFDEHHVSSTGWSPTPMMSAGMVLARTENVLCMIGALLLLSLIHISEPTRRRGISYAVFCLKKKK